MYSMFLCTCVLFVDNGWRQVSLWIVSLPYFFQTVPLIEPRAPQLARLADQQSPGVFLPLFPHAALELQAHTTTALYFYNICAVIYMNVPWFSCGGQRTTCQSWFSPSTLWTLRIELKSSAMVASTLTHWVILLAPCPDFYMGAGDSNSILLLSCKYFANWVIILAPKVIIYYCLYLYLCVGQRCVRCLMQQIPNLNFLEQGLFTESAAH